MAERYTLERCRISDESGRPMFTLVRALHGDGAPTEAELDACAEGLARLLAESHKPHGLEG